MFFSFQLEWGIQCFSPMHLRSGPVSLLLLLLPPLHHIKVPRGSKESQVEVILSDKMSREPWSRDQRWMGCLWKWHRQHISWWSAGISKPKNSKVQRDLVVARPIHCSTFSFEYRSNQPLPNCICPFHLHETIQCCDRALNLVLALTSFMISPDLLNCNRNFCTTQTFCTRHRHRMSELVHTVQPTSLQSESLSTAGFGGIAPACTATTRNGTTKRPPP